jgi:cell division septation protein DedD
VAQGTAPRHASSKGAWSVQLGSFASKANAEKLVQVLAAKGYSVALSSIGAGSAARYRVRVGQLSDRQAALRVIGKLKSQGRVATLVPPI